MQPNTTARLCDNLFSFIVDWLDQTFPLSGATLGAVQLHIGLVKGANPLHPDE